LGKFSKNINLDFSLGVWDRVPSEEALTGHTNGTPGFEEGSKRAQLFYTETRKFLHNNSLGGAVSAVVLGRNTLYTHAALFSKV
jgi:hypothetical protein